MPNDQYALLMELEGRIGRAGPGARLDLQPEFSRVLESLSRDGVTVPRRLKQLEAALVDEAIEARFDNMPV